MDLFKTADQSNIKKLFIHQLNRVNCTKGYVIRNLPALADMASFRNMKLAIMEAHDDAKKQQSRVDDIYKLLGSQPSDEGCEVIKAVMEEAYHFGKHNGLTKIINDMDIILYMRLIENINLTSFNMLKMINQFIGNPEVTQLLSECCDENSDNDKLFKLISEEYLTEKVQ
jgi:ferritin-like metal-binding protein YciE